MCTAVQPLMTPRKGEPAAQEPGPNSPEAPGPRITNTIRNRRARVRRLTPANPRTQRNPRAPSNECQPAPLDVDYDGGVERELACFEFGEIGDSTAMPQESQAHVGSFGSCRFPGSEGDNCMEGAGVWG